MKRVFKSKVDIALPILFLVSSIAPIVIGIREKDWIIFVILIFTIAFIMYLLYDTNYIVTEGNLKVHSGFIVNKNISISKIKAIKKTDSLLSAPAASISDRIEVFYENSKSIVISPNDKHGFIEELLKRNSNIKIEI